MERQHVHVVSLTRNCWRHQGVYDLTSPLLGGMLVHCPCMIFPDCRLHTADYIWAKVAFWLAWISPRFACLQLALSNGNENTWEYNELIRLHSTVCSLDGEFRHWEYMSSVLYKEFKLGHNPGILNPGSSVLTLTNKSSTYIHIYEVVKWVYMLLDKSLNLQNTSPWINNLLKNTRKAHQQHHSVIRLG